MNAIVTLRGVCKRYGTGRSAVEALRGVDLELEEGRYYSIVGPSGSGKSTLLHIIGCMDTPTQGDVSIRGRDTRGLTDGELTAVRAREIGFVFQSFHLNPILTARENVAIALRFVGVPRRAALRKADRWLGRVGLGHRVGHYPAQLSGGERQRVGIARALVKAPSLVLADEPTGNLDSRTGAETIQLLRQISQDERSTVVQVTHDPEVARIGDSVITLRDGRIEGNVEIGGCQHAGPPAGAEWQPEAQS
jgi:putative ABC transport system ATP-binding protein